MDRERQDPDATDKLWSDGDVSQRAEAVPDVTPAPDVMASPEAPPTKVCPKCSVAEPTSGAFCPHCATPYDRSARRSRPSRRAVLAVFVALLVLGGGGTAAALITKHNTDQKHQRDLAAAAHRRADAQRQARLAQIAADRAAAAERRAQEAKDAATRSIRRSLVNDLRKAITKDARGRVADGYLDGPIYGTQCDPVGGGNASNLDARTGRYSCLAYNKKNDDGTIEGYGFTATVNFEKFSYQWHLGNA
jgi:hypothetical protein